LKETIFLSVPVALLTMMTSFGQRTQYLNVAEQHETEASDKTLY